MPTPTLGSLSNAVIPASRPSQSTTGDLIEPSPKVRVVEIPRPPSPPPSQLRALLHLQHSKVESRRVRAALEDRDALYEHDKVIWLQRAAAYELQLKELAVAHAATEKELRETIDNRLREISSLRQDLGEKNSMIEGIGLRCDELNTALAVVRDELKEEREKSKAEREAEIRNLEERLMSNLQVRRRLFRLFFACLKPPFSSPPRWASTLVQPPVTPSMTLTSPP